jgi:hypothetical protein
VRKISASLIPASLVLLLLAACGGGGGGDDGGGPNPPPTVTVSGVVRFARVPFRTSPFRLDYANPVFQPARGVVVRVRNASTQVILALSETSATGAYSVDIPANTGISIQVVAQMVKSTGTGQWDMRVQDVSGNVTLPYFHSTAANSGSGVVQNIDIPVGIDANGTATGTRASGPFAILDTLYQAIQTVLSVKPDANMPPLVVDWGTQTQGTFFSPDGTTQRIALLSDLTEDTDEFDRHTIAHEFGHYIENNFARKDSIGGDHGLGDLLDPRVAFGEGWGYAFAAIVLGDPLVLDSFVDNGQQVAGGFNVETNPPGGFTGPGCWCSEPTVWALLWDLYDNVADANDTLALGFQPVWDALTGGHSSTRGFATIFSYIEALKTARPQDAAAINTLVAAQNIDSATIDAFATTETHAPLPNQLPVYTNIVKGTPVVLRNTDDAGHYNKLGNHRFLRFVPLASETITITLTTSNPNGTEADPDFLIYRDGEPFGSSTQPPNAQRNEVASGPVTVGSEYILDVYDCANGCGDVEGIPGDYDLTVLIQ